MSPSRRALPRPPAAALGLVALALAAGCAASSPARQERQEAAALRGRVVVRHAEVLGPYLDASFESLRDGRSQRFYFPDDPGCRALLVPGHEARYRRVGSFGLLRDEHGTSCTPVGIATLGRWRDLEAPDRPARPPRVLAEYRPLAPSVDAAPEAADAPSEPGWLLVRGRFPLALAIRWPRPMDTVAVLPRRPACEAASVAGRATLEFRADLERPFWLETEDGRCPVEGFAIPPDAHAPAPAAEDRS